MRTAQHQRDGRTGDALDRDASMTRLKPIDPAVSRRDAYAPADVRADAERGTVRGEQRALAARRAARSVRGRIRVERTAPERVGALERQQRLRDVCLGNQDGAGCAQGRDELFFP